MYQNELNLMDTCYRVGEWLSLLRPPATAYWVFFGLGQDTPSSSFPPSSFSLASGWCPPPCSPAVAAERLCHCRPSIWLPSLELAWGASFRHFATRS